MREKYYSRVDETPLKVWRKCNEGEFIFIRRDKEIGTEQEDLKAWEILYNDWIRQVGLSAEFLDYLELIQEKIEAQFEYLETRNRFILNKIKMLEAQISDYEKTGGKGLTISEALVKFSKMQGFRVNENETTILEYFILLKNYNNGGSEDKEE